jgi:hypothetical protein
MAEFPKPFPPPRPPREKPHATHPPIPKRHPLPPTHVKPGDPIAIFEQIKWSQEYGVIGDIPVEGPLNNGRFTVDFSNIVQSLVPQLNTPVRNSNHEQATILLSGNGEILKVRDTQPAQYYPAKIEVEGNFAVRGVSYPYGSELPDGGVLLSAYAYAGGLQILMQWDDVGDVEHGNPLGNPDWDYNDNTSSVWVPIAANINFTVQRDPRNSILKVMRT